MPIGLILSPKLRRLSRRNISGGAVYDCFMGAGVPPFMGALPLVALWGALKVFRYPEFLPQYPRYLQ